MPTRATISWLFLAVALTIVPILAFAADEIRIDKSQRATLYLTNGRKLTGTLMSLNSKEVMFQVTGKTEIGRYLVAQIKSVKTVDDEYTYDADVKGFISAKATGGKVAATSGAPADGKPPGGDKGTESVIAEGTGKTGKSALKDAFRTLSAKSSARSWTPKRWSRTTRSSPIRCCNTAAGSCPSTTRSARKKMMACSA